MIIFYVETLCVSGKSKQWAWPRIIVIVIGGIEYLVVFVYDKCYTCSMANEELFSYGV